MALPKGLQRRRFCLAHLGSSPSGITGRDDCIVARDYLTMSAEVCQVCGEKCGEKVSDPCSLKKLIGWNYLAWSGLGMSQKQGRHLDSNDSSKPVVDGGAFRIRVSHPC